jgi:hypothetical protein
VAVSFAGVAPAASARTVLVPVRPALAGVPVLLDGQRFVTNTQGYVAVNATPEELANAGELLRRRLRVLPARIAPGVKVRFSRWVGHTAALVVLQPVRIEMVDPAGRQVAPALAPFVVVRGTDGSRVRLPNGRVSWLPSRRAILRPGSGWQQQRVSYSVLAAPVRGTDIVRRGQQRITPSQRSRVRVRALLFDMSIKVTDVVLGAPRGDAVVVRFPDGRAERHTLDREGRLVLRRLPRGDYVVKAKGSGISFAQPVALSRSQLVELRVIGWSDVGGAMAAVLAAMAGLALARRRRRRRIARAVRSPGNGSVQRG